MKPDLLLAVTLGEVHEPAGIVLCHRREKVGKFDKRAGRWSIELSYSVQRIEALERAGRYSAVVDTVAAMAAEDKAARLSLVVDATACGRPPLDLMRERGLKLAPIVIGEASSGARVARGALQLPKRELVACLSIVLGDRRLKVDRDMANAVALATQLERFRTTKPHAGPTMLPIRLEDERDELVRALALALWWGENRLMPQTKQPPVPRQPIKPEPGLTFDMAMKLVKRAGTARQKVARI